MRTFKYLVALSLAIQLLALAKPHPKPWSLPHNLNLNKMRAVVAFKQRSDGSFCQVDVRKDSQLSPSFVKTARFNKNVSINNKNACSVKERKAFQKTASKFNLRGAKAKKTSVLVGVAGSAIFKSAGIGCIFGTVVGFLDHAFGGHGERTVKKILEDEGIKLPKSTKGVQVAPSATTNTKDSQSQTEASSICATCEEISGKTAVLGPGGAAIGLIEEGINLRENKKNLASFQKDLVNEAVGSEKYLLEKEINKLRIISKGTNVNRAVLESQLRAVEELETHDSKKLNNVDAKIRETRAELDKIKNRIKDRIKNRKAIKTWNERIDRLTHAKEKIVFNLKEGAITKGFLNEWKATLDDFEKKPFGDMKGYEVAKEKSSRLKTQYIDRMLYNSKQFYSNLNSNELIDVIEKQGSVDQVKKIATLAKEHKINLVHTHKPHFAVNTKLLNSSHFVGSIFAGIAGALVCEDGTTYFLKDNPEVDI